MVSNSEAFALIKLVNNSLSSSSNIDEFNKIECLLYISCTAILKLLNANEKSIPSTLRKVTKIAGY